MAVNSYRLVPSAGRCVTPPRASRERTFADEFEEHLLQDFSVTPSAKGDVEIDVESCPDGKFVKVHNKGEKEISIGGYQLVRLAETVFKFHRTMKLEGGASATVWSADAGAEHDPPHSIVMKAQKWFAADNFSTVLIKSNQEVSVGPSESVGPSVAVTAMRALHRLHGCRHLCDAVLRTKDGAVFPVHRVIVSACSPYFHERFTDPLQSDVLVDCVRSDTLQQLIEYAYLRRVQITDSNVCALLAAADRLSFGDVRTLCCAHLRRTVTPDN